MIKPYYQDSHCIIYHGNCLDILPHLEPVDLVLTDPPYGIGEHGGKCRTRGNPGYSKHKNMGWDKHRPPQTAFDLMLTAGEVSVIWGGNYFADMLPATMGWLYWRKLMGGDFSDGELAWTSRNRALKEFTICPKGMDKKHPCQKPIKPWHTDRGEHPTAFISDDLFDRILEDLRAMAQVEDGQEVLF